MNTKEFIGDIVSNTSSAVEVLFVANVVEKTEIKVSGATNTAWHKMSP